jgi:hypothetical protein
MINIKGLDKARILVALHRRSRRQGMGFLHPENDKQLTIEEAQALLEKQTYFDYLRGRVMKVGLGGNLLDPRLYDRDNGEGAAEFAILEEFTRPEVKP